MYLWSTKVQNTCTAVMNITVNMMFCLIGNGEADRVALVEGKQEMPSEPGARSHGAATPCPAIDTICEYPSVLESGPPTLGRADLRQSSTVSGFLRHTSGTVRVCNSILHL